MEHVLTITADIYCEMLIKVRRVFQNRQCWKLLTGIILPHDNAHPNVAALTFKKIQDFRWEFFITLHIVPTLHLATTSFS